MQNNSAIKPKYVYHLKAEGTGNSVRGKVFKYNSAKAVGNAIEALDDPKITFEGAITIRRIKND